jgi:hypothetical protein
MALIPEAAFFNKLGSYRNVCVRVMGLPVEKPAVVVGSANSRLRVNRSIAMLR